MVLIVIKSSKISAWSHSGWKKTQDFRSALFEGRQRDLRTKTSNIGPHRSDIKFFFCDDDVKNRTSPEENKSFFMSYRLVCCNKQDHNKAL